MLLVAILDHVLANAATKINDLGDLVAAFARTWGFFTRISNVSPRSRIARQELIFAS